MFSHILTVCMVDTKRATIYVYLTLYKNKSIIKNKSNSEKFGRLNPQVRFNNYVFFVLVIKRIQTVHISFNSEKRTFSVLVVHIKSMSY